MKREDLLTSLLEFCAFDALSGSSNILTCSKERALRVAEGLNEKAKDSGQVFEAAPHPLAHGGSEGELFLVVGIFADEEGAIVGPVTVDT